MQTKIKPQTTWVQVFDLTMVQLSNLRWVWRSMLITGILTPCLSMAALGFFAQSTGIEALSYIYAGNIVLALMFQNLNNVCSNFSYMKVMGTFYFFATLPIYPSMLIIGTVISFLCLSLPSVSVVLLFGALLLKIPLHIHPLVILTVPLIAISLSAIGAFIGAAARTPEQAGSFSLLLTFLLLGLGPVVISPSRLPAWLVSLGWFSPSSYAVSAIRQVLIGPVTNRIIIDLAFLTIFTLIAFWIVERKMDWRQ